MTKITIDPDEMISVDDAAVQLDISIATAWRWVRDGKLKTTRLFGRTMVDKDVIADLKKKPEEK